MKRVPRTGPTRRDPSTCVWKSRPREPSPKGWLGKRPLPAEPPCLLEGGRPLALGHPCGATLDATVPNVKPVDATIGFARGWGIAPGCEISPVHRGWDQPARGRDAVHAVDAVEPSTRSRTSVGRADPDPTSSGTGPRSSGPPSTYDEGCRGPGWRASDPSGRRRAPRMGSGRAPARLTRDLPHDTLRRSDTAREHLSSQRCRPHDADRVSLPTSGHSVPALTRQTR